MSATPLTLIYEDPLSRAVLRRSLAIFRSRFTVVEELSWGGYSRIEKNIYGFNKAAQGHTYLVLTDLDQRSCPPELIASWLRVPKHPNLIFRIAVREVEAWLLADRKSLADFLGIRVELTHNIPDELEDPKKNLVDLAKKTRITKLRKDLTQTSWKR